MRAPLTLALCTLVTAQPPPRLGPTDLERNGPSENRVDVIVMGDGYRADQQNQFNDIAKHVPKLFEHDPALGEYQHYFNFARVNLVSKDDGISGFGRTYDTALGGYMTGNVKGHGQAGVDHAKVDAVLAGIPQQDGLAIVFVNKGRLGTGGGGVAVIGGREDDTVIHEWGHAFVGLGDEYIDMVHRGAAGQRANVSNSSDPKEVPWSHWLAIDAPSIGVYEGAAGMQRGAWKPTTGGCVMEHGRTYCRVCREAVVLAIHAYVDPIEGVSPDPKDPLTLSSTRMFEVTVMRPKKHALEVRWWFLAEKDAPALARVNGEQRAAERPTRATRGPLPEIKAKPTARTFANGKGVHTWRLVPRTHQPGRYVLVCRAKDLAKVDDQDLPWVIKDEQGLLESERRWSVVLTK